MIRLLKKWMRPLAGTPLHPQWLAGRGQDCVLEALSDVSSGDKVLDVGCADQWVRQHLNDRCHYVGLDYPATAVEWYGTRADVFADAQSLPIQDEVLDCIILLDVLEHVPDTDKLISEVQRTLRPGGTLVLRVPFLYPLHDEPRDFVRLTRHGFESLASKHDFVIRKISGYGHPLETAALLANIALTKTFLNWISGANPLALLLPILPFFVVLTNLAAATIASVSRRDPLMPMSYSLTLCKPERTSSFERGESAPAS